MLSARSSPIKHKELIFRLLEGVKHPDKLAVIHCKGHQKGERKGGPGEAGKLVRAKQASREATPVTAICPLFPKGTLTPDYTPEEHFQYAE